MTQLELEKHPDSITAIVQDKKFEDARIFEEESIIKVRPLINVFQGMLLHASIDGIMELRLTDIMDAHFFISFLLLDQENQFLDLSEIDNALQRRENVEGQIVGLINHFGFVKAKDLAKALNLGIKWNGNTRTVIID